MVPHALVVVRSGYFGFGIVVVVANSFDFCGMEVVVVAESFRFFLRIHYIVVFLVLMVESYCSWDHFHDHCSFAAARLAERGRFFHQD